ncbi:hypothetical protein, partial [Mesorhizobium sp.]|uniref:hypothetical protein n=1 Tax=Mesorhizobium sp. TaxID=1871066 RepID=UPI00257CC090
PTPPHTAALAVLVFERGTSKPASGPAKTRLNGGCGEKNGLGTAPQKPGCVLLLLERLEYD